MPIKQFLSLAVIASMLCAPAFAAEEHGGAIHHAFQLQAGVGSRDDGMGFADWDFHGWIGTDENKLWLKSEGEREHGVTESAEFWAMYSRTISTFWDAQIGARHDTQLDPLTYAVVGFTGLAPYFLETEAHLFVSEDGDISARLHQETELLLTQKLILHPYVEANFFAQDVPELEVGAGLSSAELGIQTRYELTRAFATYVDIKYERQFGETSAIAKRHGEDNHAVIGTLGISLLF